MEGDESLVVLWSENVGGCSDSSSGKGEEPDTGISSVQENEEFKTIVLCTKESEY